MEDKLHPYETLTPDRVLAAVEALGFDTDARIFPLNSYENRVYQVGLNDGTSVIIKVYRPGRWSDEQILEEHEFAQDLMELDVPVAAPMVFAGGQSLMRDGEFRLAVFPRLAGRAPELNDDDSLAIIGRYIGRVHLAGCQKKFKVRRQLSLDIMAVESRQFLLEKDFIPAELIPAYESLTQDLIDHAESVLASTGPMKHFRIHGDCHLGNILWHQRIPHFVDFDDAMSGPAIQDLWMLLNGDRDRKQQQMTAIIRGYSDFHRFRTAELACIELLRTLRIIHYSAWLARRWEDPAFPRSFPWFNTQRYWSEHILELREQLSAMQEPPLELLS